MLAVVVVRQGVLPVGADEAVAECAGRGMLIGSGVADAVETLHGVATELTLIERAAVSPAADAALLAELLGDEPHLVMPATPDGRDLAPRLAAATDRAIYAQASSIAPDAIELVRRGGAEAYTIVPAATFVATLIPHLRGVVRSGDSAPTVTVLTPIDTARTVDATSEAELPPDAATVDLGEAPRIVGGGAGLDSADRFLQLAELGGALGASVGATRVITDRGWIEHDRQIGTTGVVVDPQLYLAFGISGAVQHTSGLGTPDHIIAINTDPHCPMMQMADLAIVADANEVLDHLNAALVGERTGSDVRA